MKEKQSIPDIARKVIKGAGVWLILLLLVVILSVFSDKFLTYSNLINVLRQNCVVGVTAVGLTFLILSGEIDMSAGVLANIAGCISALMMVNGVSVPLAIIIGILAGVFVGFVNGIACTFLGVPAFITTLGMQYILNGFMYIITGGYPIINLPESFLFLGRGYVFDVVPFPAIILLALTLIGAFVFKYTTFGRNVLSVGANRTASALSGINVKKTKILAFMVEGACCALAGLILTARIASGTPGSVTTLSLEGMTGVFVGGTTFMGTSMGLIGTLAGVLTLGVMKNGMNLIEISSYWQDIVLGVITISVVAYDGFRRIRVVKQGHRLSAQQEKK